MAIDETGLTKAHARKLNALRSEYPLTQSNARLRLWRAYTV